MRKGTFWLVWGLGFGPLLLAILMYWTGIGIPEGRTHHGELLAGGATVADWQVKDPGGQAWQGREQWQLLLTIPDGCQQCAAWRERMPNLWTAIGKERDRVEWHPVTPSASPDGLVSKRVAELGAGLWVVDPLGNLVLRYELDVAPEGVLEDLRKLLKLSSVG